MFRLPLLLLALFSAVTRADSTVVVGCGNSIPPYVIRQNDRGMMLDVLRQSLATQGYALQVRYHTNAEGVDAFNHGELDILCISNAAASPGAYFSAQPLMKFQNIAVSLAERNIDLSEISQLKHYRVNGFNYATRLLPRDYADSVALSPHYEEYADQREQVASLFDRHADVIILDQTIFRYFLSQLRRANPGDPSLSERYRYHNLFEPAYYYAAFHSESLRDAFDEGLTVIRESGEYHSMMDTYQKMLADYLFH